MRVLFQSRCDLFEPRGGDTYQMEFTRSALKKLDRSIEIDISLDLKLVNIADYDIVHLFNIDWIPETYVQAKWAKRHHKPIVLSAIHHSQTEIELFEKKYRFGIRRISNCIGGTQVQDLLKNIFKSFFVNHKKTYPTILQLLRGVKNNQRYVLNNANRILVQTFAEADDIITDFELKKEPSKYVKVVNGVNTDLFVKANKEAFKVDFYGMHPDAKGKNIIINVGRVEPRKNQLSLIEAYKKLPISIKNRYLLLFIGQFSRKNPEYLYRFKKQIRNNKNIYAVGQKSLEYVASAMANSNIYVHPSWFETSGLVSLEAAVSGLKIVVSGERAREYLGENALYCRPDDISSITGAIIKSVASSDPDPEVIKSFVGKYTWMNAARQTLDVYNDMLKI